MLLPIKFVPKLYYLRFPGGCLRPAAQKLFGLPVDGGLHIEGLSTVLCCG